MDLIWRAYGPGHLAKSIRGYYLVYRNFDNERKTIRWFAKYEPGSYGCGEQVSRIECRDSTLLKKRRFFARKMREM
jgi:hypothetical protein